jgi:hypothetical protein
MSRYWKVLGVVTFLLAMLVSVFLYSQDSSDHGISSKPPTSRFITN